VSVDSTIIQTDTISQATDGWSVPVTFQQFSPSAGTLISVGLSLTGTVTGIAALENLGVAAETTPVSVFGTIALNAGTVAVDQAYPVATGSVTLGAYDGTLDFAGSSGTIATFSNSAPGTLTNAVGSLSAFVGTGTIGWTATSQALLSEQSNGNILSVTRAEAGASISLRYDSTGGGTGSSSGTGSEGSVTSTYFGPTIFPPGTETMEPQVLRVADATSGWNDSLTLGEFNPSLGTLLAVSLTVISDINAGVALENLGSYAATAGLTEQGNLNLILPGSAAVSVGGPTISATANLGAFDGTIDFAGGSGTLVSGVLATGTVTDTIQQSLSAYIGTGTTTIDVASSTPAYLTGPADLAAELVTNAGAVVEVSYIYAPASTAAATGTLAIAGATAHQTTGGQTPILPFLGVTITDPAVAQTETVSITLSNPANGALELDLTNGVFADSRYNPATGVWTATGSASDVTADLQQLAFVPASMISAGLTIATGFTISVTDTAGTTVTDTTTSVIETAGAQIDTVAAAAAVQTALGDSTVTQTPLVSQSQAVACFAAGTRIATPDGPVLIEELREGDLVLTESGTPQPIAWIGRRTLDCRRHPDPDRVRPVRIARHAFGMNRPCRAVLLSPDHAVFVEDVMIPVKFLINGTTIVQTRATRVTYYHLELPRHDVVLAESLPCESYLETGGRSGFENGGPALDLYPDFAGPDDARVSAIWRTQAYAPLISDEATLLRVQARLAFQAQMLPRRRTSKSGTSGALEISDTIAQ
jgi:hypothetical protein